MVNIQEQVNKIYDKIEEEINNGRTSKKGKKKQ
jgi:hypothetical protein